MAAIQEIWLLPGLYFIEMAWLPLIGAALAFLDTRKAVLGMWAISGAILGFAMMGAMSVGFNYLPVFVLMGISSLLSPKQRLRDILLGLVVAILAGVVQAGIMLAAIQHDNGLVTVPGSPRPGSLPGKAETRSVSLLCTYGSIS